MRPEDLTKGDKFTFNDRTEPCTVNYVTSYDNAVTEGNIRIITEIGATGPRGAGITLQRTGSGRLRCSPSKFAPYANVYSFTVVEQADPPKEQRLRQLGESLFD